MGFKVIFAPQAIESLSLIVEHIARDNSTAAEGFGLKLIAQAEILADFPELGTSYRKRANVRRLWCKPYFIYYRINHRDETVEIMEFWHSARQDPELR